MGLFVVNRCSSSLGVYVPTVTTVYKAPIGAHTPTWGLSSCGIDPVGIFLAVALVHQQWGQRHRLQKQR